MLSVLLVGKNPDSLAGFADELSRRQDTKVRRVTSGKDAWEFLGNNRGDVVVTDQELADGLALTFVHELTRRYPLINCAMVSSLSPKDFHEATEGLGVFMQLPADPGVEEAAKMVRLLESIDALLGM
jgi:DNA-binding NarL/FixJ family response regulator